MAPVTTAPNPKQEGAFEPNRRAFALMGLNESSHMSADDAVACQSLEVFEATQSEISDVDLRAQYPSLAIGQLGIRCIHCSSSPKSVKETTYFPASISGNDSLPQGVRMLADRHLGKCSMAPTSVRDIIQQATEKRSKNDQERGSSWNEDEGSRSALRDWCYRFCQRLGIVDKGNDGTGLAFAKQTSENMQGPGLPGRPRPGPMGHLGAEPLAPTPVASRRDRPGHDPGEYRPGAGFGAYGRSSEGYYGAPDPAMHARGGHESHQQSQNVVPGQPAGHSPHRGYQQQEMMAHLPMSGNYPYYQEASGNWSCKYCSHIPPPYREPQATWSVPDHMPPPPQYVDQHLSMCRAYHQSMY